MKPSKRSIEIGGKGIRLETGRIARQAGAAVLVRQGPTALLVTVTADAAAHPEGDFFPLTVEYREKAAATGRIPGGFLRREGRISDHEVLVSRLIDRSIRPLCPKGFKNEGQVTATVLSAGPDSDPAPLAVLGAGAALHLSEVPWNGPCGGLRVAWVEERAVALPGLAVLAGAEADLLVSAGPGGLTMVEGGGREISEETALALLEEAGKALGPYLALVEEWRAEAGREKLAFVSPEPDERLLRGIEQAWGARLAAALRLPGKKERRSAVAALKAEALVAPAAEAGTAEALDHLEHELLRRAVLEQGFRPDGRGPAEIRPIWAETRWLEGPHGSAIFTRGETQALVTCTLAGARSAQTVEGLQGSEEVTFLLHYNFPPYSVGETRALRGPGRREIGHGALARRALLGVLPAREEFPYVIRVESDITESNGSSSMATVCGGSLAMMDAGVPLKAPVAGIAMGLVAGGGRTAVLSDILGDEDHLGDMDFKVAGSSRGITALQMDNKVGGLGREVLERALEQARLGRLHILGEMAAALGKPRAELPANAPQAKTVRIRPNCIGLLIGPKGANIKAIQEESGAEVGVDESGLVTIYAKDGPSAQKALQMVRASAGEVQVGRVYRATVVSVKEFGAFVRIYPHVEGLVHVTNWAESRIEDMREAALERDEILVKVLGTDERGRLVLSRKEALGTDPALVAN